jgi:hypothetical protein
MHQIIRRVIKTVTTITWTIQWETADEHPHTCQAATPSPDPPLLLASSLPSTASDSVVEFTEPDPCEMKMNR